MKKIRYLALLKSGENITSEEFEDDGEFPVFGGNGIRGYSSRFSHQGHYVLIGRQGALCGNINYAQGKFWASEHAIVVSPLIDVATVWFGELLRSMNLNQYSISAAQPGLSVEMINKLKIPVPPLPEQHAIADFLERETAKLDTLVAKKRELIEKLKEKRTALISRAVTRGLPPEAARTAGLDPQPKLKPSGIEWLGEVPEHWEVNRLGSIANVVRGASPRPAGDPVYFFGDHTPWITVGDVTKDSEKFLTTTETMLTKDGMKRSRLFREGTLVLTNSGATLGVPKILSIDGCANDGIVGFEQLSSEVFLDYIYYFLKSLTMMLRDRIKQGSGQPNLNTSIVRSTAVLAPPIEEQRTIVDYLDRVTEKIDQIVVKVEEAIARLQEYRAALVTAAVTGKIDVRGVRT